MEDKMFELLSKMYGEMQTGFKEVKSDIKKLQNDVDILQNDVVDLKNDVVGLKNDVVDLKRDVVRIENKLDINSKALFDGYKQTYEKLTDMDKKIDVISTKVEKQDVEIRVIKNVANQ